MNDQAPLPLPIHPWPMSAERTQLLQQAKARIDTPIKVIPVQAAYGSPGRVLCFGSLPPFIAKTIPISPANVDSVDSIEAALRAWLDPFFPSDKFGEEFQLGVWMGAEIKLAWTEDENGPVFR
jgi:hypothetical protein